MKLTVDRSRCQEHGHCAVTAPAVFQMTQDNHLEYDAKADEQYRDLVEEAADNCPVQAILLED